MDWAAKLPATSPSAPAKLQHGLGSKQFSLFLASHLRSGPGASEPHPHGLQVWPANQNGVTPTTLAVISQKWLDVYRFLLPMFIGNPRCSKTKHRMFPNCPALPSIFLKKIHQFSNMSKFPTAHPRISVPDLRLVPRPTATARRSSDAPAPHRRDAPGPAEPGRRGPRHRPSEARWCHPLSHKWVCLSINI